MSIKLHWMKNINRKIKKTIAKTVNYFSLICIDDLSSILTACTQKKVSSVSEKLKILQCFMCFPKQAPQKIYNKSFCDVDGHRFS